MWDPTDSTKFWACRGLKTLSMRLGPKPTFWHGHVFGYLSRVCPRLEDLSLSMNHCQALALESGLCLLTRLQSLERLSIHTDMSNSYGPNQLHESRFAWIQTRPSEAASVRGPMLAHLPRSLTSSFSRHDASLEEALKEIRRLKGSHKLSETTKFWLWREEQERNRYRSYFTGPVPMVDGLKGFGFCGTYFDIEACLEAQLFRFPPPKALAEETSSRWMSVSRETPAAASSSLSSSTSWSSSRLVMVEGQHIWPRMQKITFSFGQEKNEKGQSMVKQMELGCAVLKRLRPGIQFSCPFIETPV